jgi:hypothetical protein
MKESSMIIGDENTICYRFHIALWEELLDGNYWKIFDEYDMRDGYYDTKDFHLLKAGMWLRSRTSKNDQILTYSWLLRYDVETGDEGLSYREKNLVRFRYLVFCKRVLPKKYKNFDKALLDLYLFAFLRIHRIWYCPSHEDFPQIYVDTIPLPEISYTVRNIYHLLPLVL